MPTPKHPLKDRFQAYYLDLLLDGTEAMGGQRFLTYIKKTPGARGATGFESERDVSHTSVGEWNAEVDAQFESELRSQDPEHIEMVRQLRTIKPEDVAALKGFEPATDTHHYVLLLNKIHEAFFGRRLPVAAAQAAFDHREGLYGLDPFAACVLCLEFAVRDLVRQRKDQLVEIGEAGVASRMKEDPNFALDLLAARPWANSGNAEVWTLLHQRGLVGDAPLTPFLAPPLSSPRLMPVIYWVIFRWLNPAGTHLDLFPEISWNWRSVMFIGPENISSELIEKVQQLMERFEE